MHCPVCTAGRTELKASADFDMIGVSGEIPDTLFVPVTCQNCGELLTATYKFTTVIIGRNTRNDR